MTASMDALNSVTDLVERLSLLYQDMALLSRFMADSGDYTASEVAYAMEKPYKYADVLAVAKAQQQPQPEHVHRFKPVHEVVDDPTTGATFVCACGVSEKSWELSKRMTTAQILARDPHFNDKTGDGND